MTNFKVGDVVTVVEREEAYYSGYAGNPVCFLEPGETGVIGAVKVPKVRHTLGGLYLCCIDFIKNGRKWRAGANYGNIRLLRPGAEGRMGDAGRIGFQEPLAFASEGRQ